MDCGYTLPPAPVRNPAISMPRVPSPCCSTMDRSSCRPSRRQNSVARLIKRPPPGVKPRTSTSTLTCLRPWPRAGSSNSTSVRPTAPPSFILPPRIPAPLSPSTCRRAVLLAIDGCHLRQRDHRPGPHVGEVHIGVVLSHQPNRQVGMLLSDHP